MSITLFYGGHMSQWYHAPMTINGVTYNCAEQYMMARKALAFQDFSAYCEIMSSKDPAEQKAIGRKVKNFDEYAWGLLAPQVVYWGNFNKYFQHPILKLPEGIIAEASPTDKIWGIGLSEDDPRAMHLGSWQGLNLLGEALMMVRDQINFLKSRV